MTELLIAYAAGFVVGVLVTLAFIKSRQDVRSGLTQRLMIETMSQKIVLQAVHDVVDDDTDKEIRQRTKELCDEYDPEASFIGVDDD